jgi:hypothetical protein
MKRYVIVRYYGDGGKRKSYFVVSALSDEDALAQARARYPDDRFEILNTSDR